tara:strand:- start:161 stop:1321 length:1161 start_codon:yes stop_codon:yes gene_type:complete
MILSKNRNILVFFTLGVSLKIWERSGILLREIKLYQLLIDKGYKVSFLTFGDKTDFDYEDILGEISVYPIFYYFKNTPNKVMRLISILLFILRKKNIFSSSIYLTHQMRGGLLAVISKLLYKNPLIVRCGHEWLKNSIADSVSVINKIKVFIIGYLNEYLVYNFSDHIILSSNSDAHFVKKIFPINKSKISIIRNYIDTDLFSPPFNTKGVSVHKKSILYIGRIIKRKNIASVIKALKGTGYTLNIIGEGPEQEALELLAKSENVKVSFLGIILNNELPMAINKHQIFIQPSFYENSPKTLLEAMSCGKSVIATDVEGNAELINHNVNGLLCEVDHHSINRTFLKLISDEKLCYKIGENARRFIELNCSLDVILPKYQKIINNISN